MKQVFFIFIIILCLPQAYILAENSKPFFRRAELYASIKSQIKEDAVDETLLTSSLGVGLYAKNIEASFALVSDKYYAFELPSIIEGSICGKENLLDKLSFGGGLNFNFNKILDYKLPYKVDFYAGNLYYADSISLLKNPLLRQGSALSKQSFLPPRASVALQRSFSFNSNKSNGLAFSLSSAKKYSYLPSFTFGCNADNFLFTNVYKTFYFSPLSMVNSITTGITCGAFKHGREPAKTTWKQTIRPYKEDFYSAGMLSLGVNGRLFREKIDLFLYQNPFGLSSLCFREMGDFYLGDFSLGLGLFCADCDFITAKGTRPQPRIQASINPQYQIKLRGNTLSLGIFCMEEWRITRNIEHVEYTTTFIRGDTAFSFGHGKIFSYVSCFYNDLSEKTDIKGSSGFSFNNRSVRSTTKFSIGFTDFDGADYKKVNLNINENLGFSKCALSTLYASGGICITKDGRIEKKLSGGINFSSLINNVKLNAKISFIVTGNL